MSRNTAYFAPLVCLPTVIVEPGDYITRCGEIVSVSVVSSRHDFGCKGNYTNEVRESWHRTGRLFASRETANDIVRTA